MTTDELVACPRCGAMRPAWGATPGEVPSPPGGAIATPGERPAESTTPPPASPAPPGALALPTFGTALKRARGSGGTCECGRRRLDQHGHPIDPASIDSAS